MNKKNIVTLLALLSSTLSHAYSYNKSSMEWNRMISVGAGISAPSYMTSVFENPAGLVYNTNFKFVGSASTFDTSGGFRPTIINGQFYTGNGTVGASLGVQTSLNNTNGSAIGSSLNFPVGLAASLGSVAIGLGGTFVATGSGFYVAGSSYNLGMIASINPTTFWGLEAYNIFGGLSGFGTGFSFDVSNTATLVVDGAVDRSLKGLTLKPGMVVNAKPFQLALSYGFQVDNSSSSPISTGLNFGLGAETGQNLHWQFYYNRLSTLYLGLTVRI